MARRERLGHIAQAMTAAPILYMDALLRPNRSLPRTGFIVLMTVMCAYNVALGVFLLHMGAFPVPIFLGLDVFGVWLAFRISYRQGRRAERVQVSADHVTVDLEDGAKRRRVWSSPTTFTRVVLEAPGEHEARVRLRNRNRGLPVGDMLSPDERTDFADALERAIAAARLERYAPV